MSESSLDAGALQKVAGQILDKFSEIHRLSKSKLEKRRRPGLGTLAPGSSHGMSSLLKIDMAINESLSVLMKEPAIAKVVLEDEFGALETFYICRTMPVDGIKNLASYRSDIGSCASRKVGGYIDYRDKIYTVISKSILNPKKEIERWDSLNTEIYRGGGDVITIASLRNLLENKADIDYGDEDILARLLEEEESEINIFHGIKRQVIDRISLRDRPILDEFQDKVFRLPIDRKLIILGPPGTGKTTTLIKRLGQKLDLDNISLEENKKIESISGADTLPYKSNWIMFTPTKLLRQYLKEAFAREQVPADDQHITTWEDFQRDLGRNQLRILKTSPTGRGYNLVTKADYLSSFFHNSQRECYEKFFIWQRRYYLETLSSQLKILRNDPNKNVRNLVEKINAINETEDSNNLTKFLLGNGNEQQLVNSIISNIEKEIDEGIKSFLNKVIKSDKDFLDQIVNFIQKRENQAETENKVSNSGFDEFDDDVEDDDQEIIDNLTGKELMINRRRAMQEYFNVCRRLGFRIFKTREIKKKSDVGKFIEFLGDRLPRKEELNSIGNKEERVRALKRLRNPKETYYQGIAQRYRKFRKNNLVNQNWFVPNLNPGNQLHILELDIIILTYLMTAYQFVANRAYSFRNDDRQWNFLSSINRQYRAQVYVDEASDFSPVQLKCMAALSHPGLGSFFACGDLNQRLSPWGIKSREDLKWISRDIEIKEITTTYRQTKELCDFSKRVLEITGGDKTTPELPQNIFSDGFPPILLENPNSDKVISEWIAARINEIHKFNEILPSIAIFVPNENRVKPMADLLKDELDDWNIPVVACPDGQVVGQDREIRVFDIQHIKGLEFEAVFLVGLDELESGNSELLGKMLYVGSTRAATYLGLVVTDRLQKEFKVLKEVCGEDWAIRDSKLNEP